LYVDGIVQGSTSFVMGFTGPMAFIQIGAYTAPVWNFGGLPSTQWQDWKWAGSIDEVMIWATALSASTVAAHATGNYFGVPLTLQGGLMAWYTFAENSPATTFADKANNDATNLLTWTNGG